MARQGPTSLAEKLALWRYLRRLWEGFESFRIYGVAAEVHHGARVPEGKVVFWAQTTGI